MLAILAAAGALAAGAHDFASRVVEYRPAPGQRVQDPEFNDPERALGAPTGGGLRTPDNTGLVTLGGFGGSITLAFDPPLLDHPGNPMGLDFIVYGNAFHVGSPAVRWAEAAVVEVSRDANANGLPDDPWYVIPGSHLTPPLTPSTRTWDAGSVPAAWIPPGASLPFTAAGYALPSIFNGPTLANPLGPGAAQEGAYGYADLSPTLRLGDLNADDLVDDPDADPAVFYTVPDDPRTVGVSPGSGGGDAFDLAEAVDPATGAPAGLAAVDFVRITTAVDAVRGPLGEASAEIDALARVRPACPAERDGAPGVGVNDLLAYLGAFRAAAPLAEADGLPGIGVGDLLAYLGAFRQGCGDAD